ncbi:MAG TPA: hypothetical protein VGB18_01885 [Candidatus Thermoplasmatota archaeon]
MICDREEGDEAYGGEGAAAFGATVHVDPEEVVAKDVTDLAYCW